MRSNFNVQCDFLEDYYENDELILMRQTLFIKIL